MLSSMVPPPRARRRATVWLTALLLALGACGPAEREPAQALDDVSPSSPFLGISEAHPTGHEAISRDGLVASWSFAADSDGVLRDASGNGHHGSIVEWEAVPALFGTAQRFHSTARRIHLAEDPAFDISGPITVAAWLRLDEGGHHQHVVACDDKWALWITPDDRYRLGDTRGGGFSTPPGSAVTGAWTSVVAVLDGSAGTQLTPETAQIFVNGESRAAERHMRSEEAQQRTTWAPGDLYASDACYIGFESHQGDEAHQSMPFFGAVDELMVFDRAWTLDEITAFSTRGSS
ncbi:MAG: LamG domain-containing protein [Gemmatimonadetes bacterium]|nr:LamG domain-containing protein [Gemmatimonadota bacterium]